jgi:hypothetical protein
VEWRVQEGLIATGDLRLVRTALENLLSNAWKFTAQRVSACIEFGATQQTDGSAVYFVRDNGAGFDKWRQDAERANPKLLFMTREYLMRQNAAGVTAGQFPEQLDVAGVQLKLRYRFEPAHPLDGVTVTAPLALLNQLDAAAFAASSRMNLRFHHTHLGLQAPRGFPCFLFGERHVAAGSGDPVARENRLGLVFVNLHLRFCLLERSQFNRNRRTVRR